MPGIVGIIGKLPAAERQARLQAMLQPMRREAFYSSGTCAQDDLGVAAGWVVHQGAFADCLPAWNERKDVALIFHGENFSETGDRNAASLVQQYEQHGVSFIEKLNGWFQGLIIDLRQQKVILFNDRYGLQRIYFHQDKSAFYFSSEAKSLLRVLPHLREIDLQSFAELVSCGCVMQDRTIFRGISLLPGAARWTFTHGQLARRDAYFRRDAWESRSQLDAAEFYAELRSTFLRVLPRYLRNGQPLGMSLTGGLDGRMIMAWARSAPGALPCYTFGGSYRDNSDVRLARKIARVCGQPHQVIPVDREFLNEFPALARKAIYVSDGAMDITGSAELYVNRRARQIAPVRLTGNYGSEILRGNTCFGPGDLAQGLFASDFEGHLKQAAATYDAEVQCHPVSFIAFKQVPWHHYARFSMEQAELTPRSPYLDNELVALMYQAPQEVIASKAPSFRLIAEGNEALSRIPTDRGLRHRPIPVATRVQHLYQEFTIRAEYAYDYGMPQWVAKVDRVFSPFRLERLFLGRHKFCHFRIWYRKPLAGCVKDILLDARTRSRPYLRGANVEKLVKRHIAGSGNFTSEIHRLLALELIQRELIEAR